MKFGHSKKSLRTVPTLIRSAHLEILGFPMGGVYYYKDIFGGLKPRGESRT